MSLPQLEKTILPSPVARCAAEHNLPVHKFTEYEDHYTVILTDGKKYYVVKVAWKETHTAQKKTAKPAPINAGKKTAKTPAIKTRRPRT